MRHIAIPAVLACAVLGCEGPTEADVRSPLRLSVEAPAPVMQGDVMRLMISVRNGGATSYAAEFPGSGSNLYANAVVLSMSGDTVWTSPGWVTLPASGVTFSPYGIHSFPVQWPLVDQQGHALAPGTYRLKTWLPTISAAATGLDEILHSPETPLVVVAR